jgi:hypothetical protein
VSIELIHGGEETIVQLLNQENGTSYTVSDLIIGAPTSSADVDYNTDIDITIKKEALPEAVVLPEGETGLLVPIHYNRLDLGRLFLNKHLTLRFAEGETIDIVSIAAKIKDEVKVVFETVAGDADLVPVTVDSTKLPTSVLLRAADTSLRFTGQFAVDVAKAIVQDTSIITPVEEVANAPIAAPLALKADGTLAAGTGNPNGKLIVAGNGELEIAAGARLYKNVNLIAPNENSYAVVVGEAGDWNLPYSFALLNKKNGSTITDLYDISLKVTAATGGGVLNFALKREYGKLVFVDTANDLRIVNGFVAGDQSVYQDIQRLSAYKQAFGSVETNEAGALLGDYTVEAKAVRKQATGIDPVVVTFTVSASKVAEGGEVPQAMVASFSAPVADEENVTDGDVDSTDSAADEAATDDAGSDENVAIQEAPAEEPAAAPAEEEKSDFEYTARDAEGALSNFSGGAGEVVWIQVDGEFVEALVEDLEVGSVFKLTADGAEWTVESITDNRAAA